MVPAIPHTTLTLTLDKLVTGGLGLGREPSGRVILVRGGLPGEEVTVAVENQRRDYWLGRVTAVLRPSPERQPPPCPLAGSCGGCDLAHLQHPAQVYHKEAVLGDQLRRAGVADTELAAAWQPPLVSPRSLGYRTRLRLHAAGGAVGFWSPGRHRLVAVTHCPVATGPVNRALALLAAAAPELATGDLQVVEDNDGAMVLLPRDTPPAVAGELAGQPGIHGVAVAGGKGWYSNGRHHGRGWPLVHTRMDGALLGRAEDLVMVQYLGGFLQANAMVNQLLVARVYRWLAAVHPQALLDLYCGNGNLGLAGALAADRAQGVEEDDRSVAAARRNARRNGIAMGFVAGRAGRVAARLANTGKRFDTVILDPPRRGAAELLPFLAPLGCRTVCYVSCDPATLARDLVRLQKQGFRLTRLALVDMFPQTHHIETLSLLQR